MHEGITVLDEADVAETLGLSPRTLSRWRIEGRGPSYRKLGKRVVYTPADVREYLDRCRRTSTSDALSR